MSEHAQFKTAVFTRLAQVEFASPTVWLLEASAAASVSGVVVGCTKRHTFFVVLTRTSKISRKFAQVFCKRKHQAEAVS